MPEGTTSGDETFTVTNAGQATSGTVALSLGGTNAGAFAIDSTTCGASLAGGASCTVAVNFTPGALGTLAASLSATASPGGSATAALQGEGQATAALSIDPTSKDFGQTPIGDTSTAASFTVTNTGLATSGAIAVALGGTNASDFTTQSSTCATALAPGGTCMVTVTFDSSYTGSYTASLTATATPGGSASASLTAQAITPAYFTTPNPVNFGNVLVGTSTADQTVTLTNEGQQTSGTLSTSLGGTNRVTSRSTATPAPARCPAGRPARSPCASSRPPAPAARRSRSPPAGRPAKWATARSTHAAFPNQFVGTTSAATRFTVTTTARHR